MDDILPRDADQAKGESRVRSRPASCLRSLAGSAARRSRSRSTNDSKAASTVALPLAVSRTSTPRAVARVGETLDQVSGGEPVHAVRHGAAGDQGLLEQSPRREFVRRPGATQRGQDVELPGLDLLLVEGLLAGPIEMTGESRDATEHLDRCEFEIRSLASPGLDQVVDFVSHAGEFSRSRILTSRYMPRQDGCILTSRELEHAVHTWDPERYLTYADERGRPFVELIARIAATDPATVVDLGCGPGNLTRLLKERWPDATREWARLQPRDDREGEGDRRHRLRCRRPARVGGLDRRGRHFGGRRTRLERHAPVGPRPPRAASDAGGPGQAGWLVRLPGARQLRRAEPHDPQGAGRRGAVPPAHP